MTIFKGNLKEISTCLQKSVGGKQESRAQSQRSSLSRSAYSNLNISRQTLESNTYCYGETSSNKLLKSSRRDIFMGFGRDSIQNCAREIRTTEVADKCTNQTGSVLSSVRRHEQLQCKNLHVDQPAIHQRCPNNDVTPAPSIQSMHTGTLQSSRRVSLTSFQRESDEDDASRFPSGCMNKEVIIPIHNYPELTNRINSSMVSIPPTAGNYFAITTDDTTTQVLPTVTVTQVDAACPEQTRLLYNLSSSTNQISRQDRPPHVSQADGVDNRHVTSVDVHYDPVAALKTSSNLNHDTIIQPEICILHPTEPVTSAILADDPATQSLPTGQEYHVMNNIRDGPRNIGYNSAHAKNRVGSPHESIDIFERDEFGNYANTGHNQIFVPRANIPLRIMQTHHSPCAYNAPPRPWCQEDDWIVSHITM